jgi:hypothetical protein
MDLHNNHVGILYFEEVKDKNVAEIVSFLKQKASEAVKISTIEEVENLEKTLVYID